MAEWLRAFIAEGVVVVVGCQPYPLAHSTHICPFFSLTHSSLACALSPRFGLLAPHAQALGDFGLMQAFSWLHELLNAQALAIRVLLTAVHSHAQNFPPVSHFRAQEFPGFYPRRFPLRIGEWSG